MQNREELKSNRNLISYVEQITEKSKSGLYKCPLCGSGNGHNKTGAFSVNGEQWKCFSCNQGGDLFDLIGKIENIDFVASEKRAAEMFGGLPAARQQQPLAADPTEPPADYTSFYLEANKNLDKTDYHRGITTETLNRYKVGFIENWKSPTSEKMKPTPRLIIPTSKTSYTARLAAQGDNYKVIKVGKANLFNAAALRGDMPIIICEGEIDALSIIDAGGQAIGLGGTNGIYKLLQAIRDDRPKQPLILALDNDKPGSEATDKLAEELKKLKIEYIINAEIYGKHKDANEALNSDRQELAQQITAAMQHAKHIFQEAREKEITAYKKQSAGAHIAEFLHGVAESVNTPVVPTGFYYLDQALDGGLYEGVYTIGAISSLGKTTLVLQMADQIAQSGRSILYFSLEMARSELMAKSISRTTWEIVKERMQHYTGCEKVEEARKAKTTRGILAGERYKNYSEDEKAIISGAVKKYSKYASNIYIHEGIGNIGVDQIREQIEKHINFIGTPPVVIIDYLQILAPQSDRVSDKRNIDNTVTELKRIARDLKVPIVAISSFNRSSYKIKVSMEAYKESGMIEYSSDVLIGLQLAGAGESDYNELEEKRKDPRRVELVLLKNRNAPPGETVNFNYYAMFNYFEEERPARNAATTRI